ncbi:MAG: winged helix-turn-helix transcriptional regulator [Verrucomicrobiae bacterium]|nr:winged helix-turn-helix transcriptional regulator [Verrucomicrobiae bacterium]MCB1085398.1 winged helix-turn-helix transcriptional regulator [Verrucomicrobiae bacterium]MCB1089952.1 winged helix-turn-helix transcriptional regulator [Verrucomicrobiae bacterium]
MKLGDLERDLAARRVLVSGKPITLTAREFSLLECLARHPGRIFSRDEIEDRLYGESNSPLSNAVDVAVFALMRKLGEGRDSQLIQTRRELAYVSRFHEIDEATTGCRGPLGSSFRNPRGRIGVFLLPPFYPEERLR